jgi:hypothetical protein
MKVKIQVLHLVSLRNQRTVPSLPQLYRSRTENLRVDVDLGVSGSELFAVKDQGLVGTNSNH